MRRTYLEELASDGSQTVHRNADTYIVLETTSRSE